MGLFSSIGKFFKKIFKGIKKVFSKVAEGVGKLLNSKLGKALLMAVTVFSMGSALLAGAKGFAAGQGFIGKFLNGGKEFLNSLIGTNFETVGQGGGKEMTSGFINEAGATGTPNPAGEILTGGDPTAAGGIGEAAVPTAEGSTLQQGMQPALDAAQGAGGGAEVMKTGALQTPAGPAQLGQGAAQTAAKEPGWLAKAATAAKDFAKSDLGVQMIGGAMQGYAAGQRDEAFFEHDRRVERMFENPNDPGMRMLREHDFSVNTPRGLAAAPGRLARRESRTVNRGAPTIPFARG